MPLPHDPGPHWGEVGIHGIHRQREWDAVVTVLAPDLVGDELWFVALADGRVVVDDGAGDAARDRPRRSPGRRRIARTPCRRDERVWAVAVRGIETVELERDPAAQFVELAWDGVERSVRIDGEPTLAGVPELERLGAERHAA